MTGLSRIGLSLLDEIDSIVAAIYDEARVEFGYGELIDDLRQSGRETAALVVRLVFVEGRDPSSDELSRIAMAGQTRYELGVPLHVLVGAVQLSAKVIWLSAIEAARVLDVAPADVLAAAPHWLNVIQTVIARLMDSYRTAERRDDTQQRRLRERRLSDLLTGRTSPADLAPTASLLGLRVTDEYFVFRIRADDPEVLDRFASSLSENRSLPRDVSVVGSIEGDLAGFASNRPRAIEGVFIGIGERTTPAKASEAFASASQALELAWTFGLEGGWTLEELHPRSAVVAHPEIGAHFESKYLAPLDSEGEFGRTLYETIRLYFEKGRRVEPLARALVIHPNTARFRIQRYEEVVGADLRDPNDIIGLWWALRIAELKARTDQA